MAREWAAKHLMLAAVALVVGLVVGGLGPRAEVRELKARLAEAESRPRARTAGREIANLFRGRPWDGDQAPAEPPAAAAPEERPGGEPSHEGWHGTIGRTPGAEPAEPEDRGEQVAQIQEAIALRRTQALAALREQAEASDEQMAEVDGIVGDMNADLRALAEELVATAREGEPSRRELMVFASDTLEILIGTEEALYQAFPEEQRAELSDQALDPMSYVDGGIVEVLAGLDR